MFHTLNSQASLGNLSLYIKNNGIRRVNATNLLEVITLVNTHFCGKKASTVLGYFNVTGSENDIVFFELALVFEIRLIFASKVLKIHKF